MLLLKGDDCAALVAAGKGRDGQGGRFCCSSALALPGHNSAQIGKLIKQVLHSPASTAKVELSQLLSPSVVDLCIFFLSFFS